MRRVQAIVAVLAVFVAGLVSVVFATVASANTVAISINCTSVTFSYGNIPATGGTATETIVINNTTVVQKTFSVSSPSSSDTVQIAGASGNVVIASSTLTTSDGTFPQMTSQTLTGCGAPPPTCTSSPSAIQSNFNGTLVPGGDWIWFNSVLSVHNLPASGATLGMTNATVTFTLNGSPVTLTVPNAQITYSPTATTASTSFNTSTNTWTTSVPTSGPGNQWLTGFAYQVPAGGLKALNPVTWTGTFTSDTPGVGIQWQWAAAAYTNFSTNYNALGVKPVDSNNQSVYQNSDHAGTPENFKSDVTGGAAGGGGSNFTGSYSGTGSASITCTTPTPTTTVTDNFDGPNGPLSPNWTAIVDGGMAVSNGMVAGTNPGADSGDIRTAETYTSDQSSQIQVTSVPLSGGQWIGPAVRAQNDGLDLYVGIYWWNNGSPVLMLFLRNDGNWTQLGQTYQSGPLPAGTQLTLIASGSFVTFQENGVGVITTTDTTLTAGAPAIMAHDTPTAANWVGTDIG